MTPDVNVLVAASRADHPHHAVALDWLRSALAACERGARFAVLPMVAASFLRLVTSPRVFHQPTPPDQAWAFLRAVLDAPGVQMPTLGPEWPAFEQLCRSASLTGNDIPDAWIAAAVKATGEHLATFDHDFTRLLSGRDFTLLPG